MSIAITSNLSAYSMYSANKKKETITPSTSTVETLKSSSQNNLLLALPQTELPDENLRSEDLLGQVQYGDGGGIHEFHAFQYKDENFSEDNPVVKVYSKNPVTGEWTKTTVNLNSVDKNNMSVLEAYGVGGALVALGKIDMAGAISLTSGFHELHNFQEDYTYEDFFEKYDVKSMFIKSMKNQYEFGNLQGYLHDKKVYDAFFAD